MNCPVCKEKTISFRDWAKARNAFRWICPHCGAVLKANKFTWITFFITLLLVTALLIPIVFIQGEGVVDPKFGRFLAYIAILIVGWPATYLSYKKCGYVQARRED
jgi:hypothetical protein